jgi:hypothetical protein
MGVVKDVPVVLGSAVAVVKEAPGVRKTLIHTGFVRMAGSTGSMNPLGLRVRKSLFGSRLDSISAFSFQLGEKRSAHCPAASIHRNPINRIMRIMIQSYRSCSNAFMGRSVDWQSHKDCCAGIRYFVVVVAFEPDASMMGIHDAARNRKSQTGPTTLEIGLA